MAITDILDVSPVVIMREYLISEVLIHDPSGSAVWPCYINFMPDDGAGAADNAVSVSDTQDVLDGRLMSGPYMRHYGIQLRVRSRDYQDGWRKIDEIGRNLEEISNEIVDLDSKQYIIGAVSRIQGMASLGTERETSRRFGFVANFKALIKMVE